MMCHSGLGSLAAPLGGVFSFGADAGQPGGSDMKLRQLRDSGTVFNVLMLIFKGYYYWSYISRRTMSLMYSWLN